MQIVGPVTYFLHTLSLLVRRWLKVPTTSSLWAGPVHGQGASGEPLSRPPLHDEVETEHGDDEHDDEDDDDEEGEVADEVEDEVEVEDQPTGPPTARDVRGQ